MEALILLFRIKDRRGDNNQRKLMMKNSQAMRNVMTAYALGMMPPAVVSDRFDLRNYSPRKQKQGKAGSSVLRGYYAKHSHVLAEYDTSRNLAKAASGKSGFKGFRKVRKFIPENGMSIWVHV